MNYYTHVESSRFKVTDVAKFKEEFHARVGGDEVELKVHEDGFQIWACNPYISNPAYDEDTSQELEMSDLDIANIVQQYLPDGEVLIMTYINRSSKDSDLGASICVATNIALRWENSECLAAEMIKNLYPRMVKCISGCHNSETDVWIEKGKEYKALETTKKGNRHYYVLEQGGHKVTWGKEYFDGTISI